MINEVIQKRQIFLKYCKLWYSKPELNVGTEVGTYYIFPSLLVTHKVNEILFVLDSVTMPSTPLLFPQLVLISRSKQSSCEARKSNFKFGTLLAKNVFIRSPHHITEEQWVSDISKKCATFCIHVELEIYFTFFWSPMETIYTEGACRPPGF